MHVTPCALRAAFCAAMSAMYRAEVPAYGTLIEIVAKTNAEALTADPSLRSRLSASGELNRLDEERHGAIRLGTAHELATMGRMFAVLGMTPVGYYDLSVAGIPVHSTAFRPTDPAALARSPFRVFTSLLRLDLLDGALRVEAEAALAARDIFAPEARRLLDKAEAEGGLDEAEGSAFVDALLETFRWHAEAPVPAALYDRLHATHPLVADVASFRGPHINHLTPRTLDIDAAQAAMPAHGIAAKAVVEGPPQRRWPILLRQTSFKALQEPIRFACGTSGRHTARFGEIEQRGAALTPKGRALYDRLLADTRADVGSATAKAYAEGLERHFTAFPDDWNAMRSHGLAYARWSLTAAGAGATETGGAQGGPEDWLRLGLVRADPIVYEDFLPVSAAGIFQSNLGDGASRKARPAGARAAFEAALGTPVADETALYAEAELASLASVRKALAKDRAAA